MRWKDGRRSDNIEDRRGESAPAGRSGGRMGGGGLLPLLLSGRFGKIGILVAIGLIIASALGVDVGGLTGEQSSVRRPAPAPSPQSSRQQDQAADFVSVVLADTETTWETLFAQNGLAYRKPKLVLFRNAVRSACGLADQAVGPFYCPADQKVYIDLSFYDDLKNRHGAPGDFAQAYVIAHEIGHHVQTLLGISGEVRKAKEKVGKVEANRLSVRQELQADCFAGLWAHHADKARRILESGDVDEALTAASAIGDDRLQRQARGYVQPDSFTHGTSEQRMRWFKRGLSQGSLKACDTFTAENL